MSSRGFLLWRSYLFRCFCLLGASILPSFVCSFPRQLLPFFWRECVHARFSALGTALFTAPFPHFAHDAGDNIFFHFNSLQRQGWQELIFYLHARSACSTRSYARSDSSIRFTWNIHTKLGGCRSAGTITIILACRLKFSVALFLSH